MRFIEWNISYAGDTKRKIDYLKTLITEDTCIMLQEVKPHAYEYIKSHSSQLEIDPAVFEEWNVHIPVPEGVNYDYDGQEHIGVEAGPYYMLSLEPGSRARIDEYGNVVATVPGTYKVTATLLLGDDSWELSDGTTSKANQTIEFTIAGAPLSEDEICDIEVEAVPVEAGTVIGGGSFVFGSIATDDKITVDLFERFVACGMDGFEILNNGICTLIEHGSGYSALDIIGEIVESSADIQFIEAVLIEQCIIKRAGSQRYCA